jgi:peptidoglycan LD-endopeptidase CwlK
MNIATQRAWDAVSLEKMRGIHPDLRRILDRALTATPFPFRVTEGLRTVERQKILVAKGASKTMRSRHLTGHAVDIVPMVDVDRDGKIEVEEMYDWPLYYKLAPVIKAAAADLKIPLEWGGDWKSFKDGPHWQLPWAAYP